MDTLTALIDFLGGEYGIYVIGAYYFSMVIGERIYYAIRHPGVYNDRDGLANFAINMFNSNFGLVMGILIPFTVYIYVYDNFRLFNLGGSAWGILAAFVAHELYYYWTHRLSHRTGLGWAFHSAHHSSNEFTFTVAARGFFLDGLFLAVFLWPGALFGISPVQMFGVMILKNMYGIFNHARFVPKLGVIEDYVATPANHRVHHGTQPKYIDKNYSQVLIIWDRMWGTFQREEETPTFGLINPLDTQNPILIELYGWRWLWGRVQSADKWQDKLAYLWRPPEWSHDGVCRSDCPKYAVLLGAHGLHIP
jgi:sterol desaturase/sphingolipid hydroxylase (fatty acid hydroxylase superfamily)